MKIWGNTIVKNEDKYIFFALMSVVDFLDKILVWDTGSTDDTVQIIKEVQRLKPKKIEFKEIGQVDEKSFTKAREDMLEKTNSDWVFILDGDEVWWKDSIGKIIETINKKQDLDLIVTPYYSIVGDIYHHQEEIAGQYNLAGKKGHLNIRVVNRTIPGLHFDKPYGQEGFFDEHNQTIQDRDSKKMIFLDAPYLHFSNIKRSNSSLADSKVMQRKRKIRHEIGIKFPKDFKYPEVLYQKRPKFIPDPWVKMTTKFKIKSYLQTPLRKIKRRLI